jgi:nucleoside-diphosphate-sugar epimerase
MNIFIIGGTRLIGPAIVRRLHEAGHAVTIFHRGETEAELPSDITVIHGDRARLKNFKKQILATNPELVLDMICLTERDAVDLMSVFDGVARRLVVASSCDVYRNIELLRGIGETPPDSARLTEDAPLREELYPYREYAADKYDWRYHYDKILVEAVVTGGEKLPATVLRLPMVYGPRDYQHRLYSYIKRMDDKRPAIILESPRLDTRWIRGYVENMAAAIVTAVSDERSANEIYNVGEPEARTEKDWITAIGSAIGWTGDVVGVDAERLPDSLRTNMRFEYHLDVNCARFYQELYFTEPVSFADGLRETIAWERANPPEIKARDYDYAAEDEVLKSTRET